MPLLLLAAILAAATPHISVATSAGSTNAKPGSTLSLFVDVIPDPKVRVYAPGAKDYLPIDLTLTPHAGVRVGRLKYPKSQIWFFEPLKERVPVYQTPFRLVQHITLASSFKPGQDVTLVGTLKYQACDDFICFTPVSAPIQW